MNRLTLCRILGIIFLLSGIAKAFNIGSFAYEVRMYADAYLWDGLAYWATPIAVLVCSAEIFFGLLALRQDYSRVCSVVFFVLLTFFTWLTAVNYFAPSLFGSIESCGCFGELIHFSPLASFVKSVILLIVACILILWNANEETITFRASLPLFIQGKSLWTFVFALLLPLYSLYTIEIMGHIIYSILYFAICIASVIFLFARGRRRCETK